MEAELEEISSGEAGDLTIGSSFPAGEPNWSLECIRTFALQRPDVSVHLRQYASSKLQAALENREIDLALSTMPLWGEGVEWREVFVEQMGIILSVHHPLAARSELSLADLWQERFYCNNANSDVQELTYVFCEQAGFRPNIHFEGEFPSFISQAVSLGHGVSIISERGYLKSVQCADRQPWEANITFRSFKEDYCRRLCGVARLSDRHFPQAVRQFYQALISSYPA